nr:hypothetical protein GCM10020092_033450 [Actinoplanes digitatis]
MYYGHADNGGSLLDGSDAAGGSAYRQTFGMFGAPVELAAAEATGERGYGGRRQDSRHRPDRPRWPLLRSEARPVHLRRPRADRSGRGRVAAGRPGRPHPGRLAIGNEAWASRG